MAHWYVCTRQLQLASLGFCRICRRFPTLHVRVEDETPHSLWFHRKLHAGPGRSSSGEKLRVVRRVPAVRALRLTWALSLDVLLHSATAALWKDLVFLRLQKYLPRAGLDSVVWPPGLKTMVLDAEGGIGGRGVVVSLP